MRPIAAGLRGLVFVYRVTLSPLLGRQCRYLPTCSQYADEALARYGAWVGGWIALARIVRCNPLGPAGLDPVPDLDAAERRKPWHAARWSGAHIPPEHRLDR